jgi:hypothetical protein
VRADFQQKNRFPTIEVNNIEDDPRIWLNATRKRAFPFTVQPMNLQRRMTRIGFEFQ